LTASLRLSVSGAASGSIPSPDFKNTDKPSRAGFGQDGCRREYSAGSHHSPQSINTQPAAPLRQVHRQVVADEEADPGFVPHPQIDATWSSVAESTSRMRPGSVPSSSRDRQTCVARLGSRAPVEPDPPGDMVQRVTTVTFEGIEARAVDVQVQVAPGLPAFNIVGLPDKAVSEAKERVRAALIASGSRYRRGGSPSGQPRR
jgi:Subunit ChlI of Mg-chelatase